MLRQKENEFKEKCKKNFRHKKQKDKDNLNNKEGKPRRQKDWLNKRNEKLGNRNKENKKR